MSLSGQTGASKEVKIGEQEFVIWPLRTLYWGVIENWMRTVVLQNSKEIIKGDNELTANDRLAIMKAAQKEAAQISLLTCFGTGHVDESTHAFLHSLEGMLRVCQQAIRTSAAKDSTPKYSLVDLDTMIGFDPEQVIELFTATIEFSFPQAKGKKKNFRKAEQTKN